MRIIEKLVSISPFFDCIDPSDIKSELFKVEHFEPDELIFQQGDTGGKAYVVLEGIISLYELSNSRTKTPFHRASKGSLFGTYAMLCGNARSATAIATTESTLASIDSDAFNQLLDQSPRLCKRMLASIAREASRGRTLNKGHGARLIVIRDSLNRTDSSGAEQLCDALSQSEKIDIIDKRRGAWPHEEQIADITRSIENERSVAFLIDEHTLISASNLKLIDANLLLISGNEISAQISTRKDEVVDLIRLWPSEQEKPDPLQERASSLTVHHVYNVRKDCQTDALRAARCILGIATTLVLGGGGAKGFAHVGAIKALQETGALELDLIYGVSIGSFVGMLCSFEMPWEAIYKYMRVIFVDGSPYSFSPSFHSLLQYSTGLEQLKTDYSSFDIHDTWIPFRPLSTNISRNHLTAWSAGNLLDRVIASMSIPGILPPVQMEDGSLHVDGSVIDNLPITEARSSTSGVVIAISLDHGEGQRTIPTLADSKGAIIQWLSRAGLAKRSMPLLTDTILYSILGAARQKSDDAEHLADCVLKPDLMSAGLLDWSCCDTALEAGYREAKNKLQGVELQPITN